MSISPLWVFFLFFFFKNYREHSVYTQCFSAASFHVGASVKSLKCEVKSEWQPVYLFEHTSQCCCPPPPTLFKSTFRCNLTAPLYLLTSICESFSRPAQGHLDKGVPFFKRSAFKLRLQPKGKRGEPAGTDCVWIGAFTSKKWTNLICSLLHSTLGRGALAGIRVFQVLPLAYETISAHYWRLPLKRRRPPPLPRSESCTCSGCTYKAAQLLLCHMKRYIFSFAFDGVSTRQSSREMKKNLIRKVYLYCNTFLCCDLLVVQLCFFRQDASPLVCHCVFFFFCGLLLTAAVH